MSKSTLQIMFPIIIMAVLATAIFGFSAMSEPGHIVMGCFGTAPGATCSMLSPIEHFAAHVHAFEGISTAVLLLLALALLSLAVRQVNAPRENFVLHLKRRGGFISPQRIQFARWLTLHEKRDPSLSCAMNS